MGKLRLFCGAVALLALGTSSPMAQAQDTLKLAAGQRGNWDTTIAEIGQLGGIFKKHGLVLEILYTLGTFSRHSLQTLSRAEYPRI